MAAQNDKLRWKKWADGLRRQMMVSLTPEVCKSIETIVEETGTTKAQRTLRSAAFWRSCQSGASTNDSLSVAGFEIEFEQDEDRRVNYVTLKLNSTWNGILQKVIDRQTKNARKAV